jgi:hypothetical protein
MKKCTIICSEAKDVLSIYHVIEGGLNIKTEMKEKINCEVLICAALITYSVISFANNVSPHRSYEVVIIEHHQYRVVP